MSVVVLLIILLIWQQMKDNDPQKHLLSRKFAIVGDWGRHGLYYQNDVAQQMAEFCRGEGGNDQFEEWDQESAKAAATLHSVRSNTRDALRASPKRDFHSSCYEVVSVGDNLYETGVSSPDSNEFDLSFGLIYLKHEQLNIDWRIMFGNHDYKKSPHAQIDYANRDSTHWVSEGLYSAYDVKMPKESDGQFRFITLDTVPMIQNYWKLNASINHTALYDPSDQLEWFEEELDKAQREGKQAIVYGHHPVYCVSDKDPSETQNMQEAIERLLVKYKVPAYISGHEHVLEHIQILYNSTTEIVSEEAHVVNYIVSGAGSRTRPIPILHPIRKDMRFGFSEGGFVGMTLEPTRILFQFISHSGDYLYEFDEERKR